jgi:phage baseplate assembly protein V
MMNLHFEVSELHRRLANMFLLGKVIDVSYETSIPRVKVAIGDLTTTWLPMLVQRAGNDVSFWSLEKGEQVLVLSPSGELTQGVVLGSINQKDHPAIAQSADVHRTQYGDGAVIEYDRKAHCLKAVLPSGATAELVADGGLTVTGDVKVIGNIVSTKDITDHTRSMKEDRDIYNQHTHGGVLSGGASTAKTTNSQ